MARGATVLDSELGWCLSTSTLMCFKAPGSNSKHCTQHLADISPDMTRTLPTKRKRHGDHKTPHMLLVRLGNMDIV
jgi:hypothetical protein